MDLAIWMAAAALFCGLAALVWAGWNWRQVRMLGLGMGAGAGPLLERLSAVGRRLEQLEVARDELAQAVGRCGLHATTVHYAPLGLGGTPNCFVLALLNCSGDGLVLNYLAGTGVRADLKEVYRWQSKGLAFTDEEARAVAANRSWWENYP